MQCQHRQLPRRTVLAGRCSPQQLRIAALAQDCAAPSLAVCALHAWTAAVAYHTCLALRCTAATGGRATHASSCSCSLRLALFNAFCRGQERVAARMSRCDCGASDCSSMRCAVRFTLKVGIRSVQVRCMPLDFSRSAATALSPCCGQQECPRNCVVRAAAATAAATCGSGGMLPQWLVTVLLHRHWRVRCGRGRPSPALAHHSH